MTVTRVRNYVTDFFKFFFVKADVSENVVEVGV